MTVYLDVIWVLNLLFDSLLLYLTAIILKRSIRIWRLLAGGFIGSIIVLLAFTPLNTFSGHPLVKLLFSVMMTLTVFGYKRWRFFTKALFTLYFSTFLIGGTLIGVHYFIQYNNQLTTSVLLSNAKGFGDPISWIFVLIGFPIAWHFSKTKIETMEMTKIQFDQIVNVVFTIFNKTFTVKGLVDSGNQLYDPISKMPVMFVSIKDQFDLMPEEIKKMATNSELLIMGEEIIPVEWQNRLRVVPFKVVGQEHQLIVAIKPDTILIRKDMDVYQCEKGLVSFTLQQLSTDNSFQCIVHPKMLTSMKQTDSVMVS
ncbi:MAG: sigma-E processing peptidase SpoIIGA [Bacillota bacterium]|nr:sigma-E processing peptidase SpoIIGA [Bacillota bacterium]